MLQWTVEIDVREVIGLRIAICDDDALCREQILAVLEEYDTHKNRKTAVSVFHSAATLIDEVLRRGGFDIYLLDIIMPGMNGIQLGMELRQVDPCGKIIYLTSSQEYALDSYRARAFDYILKPVSTERLFATLDDAIRTMTNRKEKSLIVKTRDSNVKVVFDSILYAELVDKKIVYHRINGDCIESSSIRTTFAEAIQALLSDGRFVLCGAGLAANLYYITSINNDTLSFQNGHKLYIGKRAGRDIRSVWSDFWLSGEGSQ